MTKERTLKQLQAEVDQYIGQFDEGYFGPFEILAGLMEELGEVSTEIQHLYGTKKKKDKGASALQEELGDFMFHIICMANREGIDLERALTNTLHKYETRDENRWTRKGWKND
mgnify:CR=1 FL=1